MSPEELQRIEDEERARAQARAKIDKEERDAKAKTDAENALKGCGILIAVVVVLAAVISMFSSGGSSHQTTRTEAPLSAEVAVRDGRIVIENRDSEHWLETRIEVNGEWEFTAGAIPSHMTMRYLPQVFTKSDGTRLDLDTVTVKRIDIHATTSQGRRHWNGGY